MSFLSGKQIEKIVVPVACESKQGTAFFISATQLLTARHVVKDHFASGVARLPIYIYIAGKKVLCEGKELSIPGKSVDLALLTINEKYQSTEFLSLVCDKYTKNMPVHVYGYPQEVAMGCNLVELAAKNGLEIEGGELHDRALVREDKLSIRNYEGLSGAPVIGKTGRVLGVIVVQINETLNYLSIAKAKENLDKNGILYESDWEKDDVTTLGVGRSIHFCEEAVKTIHGRYLPKLHQRNKDLEVVLDYFTDKQQLEESRIKASAFANRICTLPPNLQQKFRDYLKVWNLTPDVLADNDHILLKRCYEYIQSSSFRSVDNWKINNELVAKARQLSDGDFERLQFNTRKSLCLIGKAGSGKTHSLCHYALHKQEKANIYLFFGTDFKPNQSVITYIRESVCEELSFEEFNDALRKKNRYAVIVIDAINEGLGCSHWNKHIGALRVELEKYDHLRLVISVRMPFEKELNDLSELQKWYIYTIDGFADKLQAINDYFETYGVDTKYKEHRIDAFKNPLFLKIFCESFQSLTMDERAHINKQMLYKRYVAKKNEMVTELVDEDPELNIADRYLSKLANYSVYYGDFNPIARLKARQYARRMAPYRRWSNDLLHACLVANLLLDDRSHSGEPAVMFEYENLGDFYKAEQLQSSKMGVPRLIQWIEEKKDYFERHSDIPSEKFRNAVKALFDCWHQRKLDVYGESALQKGGSLYELYYEYLMESEMQYEDLIPIILKLNHDRINPLRLISKFEEVTLDETLQIHEHLKAYPTVGSRDLVWTRYINQMYETYGDDYIGIVPIEEDNKLDISDEEREYLIGMTWMLSSSHPKFRAIIIRKIRRILSIHTSLISWLIDLFKDVNDPYVLGGFYCAVCGVVLPSRDKELVGTIAKDIYTSYYAHQETVPQDLIVRQWTLKIIERAYYLNTECDYWKRIETPFEPHPIDEESVPKFEDINREYFGLQQGSQMMYESMFSFEDFNRYIIGTNSRHTSNDYFRPTEGGNYEGVPLQEIMTEMSYYITNVFAWNDKLGALDNGKYSQGRIFNDRERIGKKFQWLSWYRVNAHLMDTCRTTKELYYYNDKARSADLVLNPYPWNSSEVSRFDPTLDVYHQLAPDAGLAGIEVQPIVGKDDEGWIDNHSYLPKFRWLAKHRDGDEYVLLMGYDKAKEDNKDTFLFNSACFVKQEDAVKFSLWAEQKNFYGRWMPERQGSTEFLWSDYPWADAYKSSIEQREGYRSYDCSCDILLSYETQLQEDWKGIEYEDKYLSTVYMPCVEMMEQMELYCSEVRGVVRCMDGSIVALNTDNCGIDGLFVRRDVLNEYLMRNEYVMFYYVLGEKVLRLGEMNSKMRDLSAAYQYNPTKECDAIQPMRVIDDQVKPSKSKASMKKRIIELTKKNKEAGLTTREMNELVDLDESLDDSDFIKALKKAINKGNEKSE